MKSGVHTFSVTLLTTGGTIEKTYDETDGSLRNVRSVLEKILNRIRLQTLRIRHISVLNKDSTEMGDEDRQLILEAVRVALPTSDAILILHGTDTLSVTGELLCRELGDLDRPVVMTGAMRPYEFRDTDAFQNITEALLACRLLGAGIYVVMHNQALKFPGVEKDREHLTFVRR